MHGTLFFDSKTLESGVAKKHLRQGVSRTKVVPSPLHFIVNKTLLHNLGVFAILGLKHHS
jgi:hypothetical protein